jgi:hypothetical protein
MAKLKHVRKGERERGREGERERGREGERERGREAEREREREISPCPTPRGRPTIWRLMRSWRSWNR